MLLEDLKSKLKQLFLISLAFIVYGFFPQCSLGCGVKKTLGPYNPDVEGHYQPVAFTQLLVLDWGGGTCSGKNTFLVKNCLF